MSINGQLRRDGNERGLPKTNRPRSRSPALGAPFRHLLMKYAAYSTEDFLADESFQSFVVESDPAAEQFWRQWLDQNPAKEPEFDEAVALLRLLVAHPKPQAAPEALKQTETAKLWHSMHPPVAPRAQPVLRVSQRARRWASATVVAAVLLLLGLSLWQRPTPTTPAIAWTRYATHGNQHRQVTLPDGSRVVLNANSTLRLAATWQPDQPREVWLAGEAYFDVRHTAPAHLKAVATAPATVKFTVHAGPLDVAVLGTRFNVRRLAGKTKVVLVSGQIELSHRRAGGAEQLLLAPGDLVEYDEALPQQPLAKRVVNAAFYSAWTSGHLDFDNTPVAEIVTLLEETYGLDITVRNPHLLQQQLTGSIPNQDLTVLLNSLGKSLDVTVRRQGNQVWFE